MRYILSCVWVLFFSLLGVPWAVAEGLKLGIMQAQSGDAAKMEVLQSYLKTQGVDVELVGFSSYPEAARRFGAGDMHAMFAGSGIAGTLLIREVAEPLVRPVTSKGHSTYWAVVLAPKDAPKPGADLGKYLAGKKVICNSLASAGEFFARAHGKKDLMLAASHGAAVDALARGAADVAIVKNRVWDASKDKYPMLGEVARDAGENPDNALMISVRAPKDQVQALKKALLAFKKASSPQAQAVRDQLGVAEYRVTTRKDFGSTLKLLKKVGITKDFSYSF